MRKPLDPYELSRTQLEILRALAGSSLSISELARHIRKSQPTVTTAVEKLQAMGFVTVERSGMLKLVRVSEAKHAQLLREVMLAHPHIPWQSLLAFSQIRPFLELQDVGPATVSRTTEWRILRNLMAHGIIRKDEGGLKVNPRFSKISEFVREFSNFINSNLAAQVSEAAVAVWTSGSQFIMRVPQGTKIQDKRFQPTATTALPRYGIRLISDVEYYFFSPSHDMLRPEDIALHSLLIDGIVNVTYALILIAKTQINTDYLLRKAEALDFRGQVEAMLRFLETHKPQPGVVLPSWDEFVQKARVYGVEP